MGKKSCVRGCLITLLTIPFIPCLVYLPLLLYGRYNTYSRTFVADIKSVGYEMSFCEIEHDSILAFSFWQKGTAKQRDTLFVYNDAWDVVSFIFIQDSASEHNERLQANSQTQHIQFKYTILLRDNPEFHELCPNTQTDKQPVSPKGFKKGKLIKGRIPSSCKVIPFSDLRYFSYDKSKAIYFLRDSTTHIIKLVHDTERTNTYHLLDMTARDTSEIELH